MMIKLFHAIIAVATMGSTWRPEYLACHAVLDKYFAAVPAFDFFAKEDIGAVRVVDQEGNGVAAIVCGAVHGDLGPRVDASW